MIAARLVRPLLVAALLAAPSVAHAQAFTYSPQGQLVNGSGKGRVDTKVYAPTMRFPIESGPAYANSQVWGRGGLNGGGGDQCDAQNFSYPWKDNYCETRSWDMPLCPSGTGHQGQDIRAASCKKDTHWAVAAVDGTITNVGSYSVYLTAADGTRYDYLHMSSVQVTVGQKVKTGDRVGKVSNEFGGEATTVHLHFNIRQNVAGIGAVYVPPYTSLVSSYERLLGIAKTPEDAGADVSIAPPPAPTAKETPAPAAEPEPAPLAPEGDSGCATTREGRGSGGTSVLVGLLVAALVVATRRRRG
ncbi:MAG: M23 family metallopeptidase [Deltaproteobacteria bacterium]|nr:M23 family metallopeptidase [Deltaproteobacteria bacterium]